jgi:hypothetical protein
MPSFGWGFRCSDSMQKSLWNWSGTVRQNSGWVKVEHFEAALPYAIVNMLHVTCHVLHVTIHVPCHVPHAICFTLMPLRAGELHHLLSINATVHPPPAMQVSFAAAARFNKRQRAKCDNIGRSAVATQFTVWLMPRRVRRCAPCHHPQQNHCSRHSLSMSRNRQTW